MSHQSRLLDLVVEWEELRSAGRSARAEDLCRDCPELVDELLQASSSRRSVMNAVLAANGRRPTRRSTAPKYWPSRLAIPAPWAGCRLAGLPAVRDPGGNRPWRHGRGAQGPANRAGTNRGHQGHLGPRSDPAQSSGGGSCGRPRPWPCLQHPNIVQIHEIGQQGEHPFLVMEYVEGREPGGDPCRQALAAAQGGRTGGRAGPRGACGPRAGHRSIAI